MRFNLNNTLKILPLLFVSLCLFLVMGCAAPTQTRLLPLAGAHNVRDMGGYPTEEGKIVKWNHIYRGGDLDVLTDSDIALLKKRNIKTVVDFRSLEERDKSPHRLPSTVKKIVHLPIDLANTLGFEQINEATAPKFMKEANKALAETAQQEYAAFFAVLAEPTNVPIYFNCSAGKDRTGLAAALFLASLGVDRETIFQDYLLSAEYVKDKYAAQVAQSPWLAPLYTVKREYLEAAFAVIDTQYGGVGSYLHNQLGVNTALIKSLYTE